MLHVQSFSFANLNQDYGRDPFNQNSNQSDREKWSTSKGGPVFSKLFRLDRTDPLSFRPKFPEILAEWIAPHGSCLNLLLFLPFSFPLPSPSSLLKLPTEDNADTKFWGAVWKWGISKNSTVVKSQFCHYLYQGVPTHDQAGEPLSGKQVKKLKKLYQQQEKLYNSSSASVASQATNGSEEQ